MTAEISIPGICANAAMGPAPGNMGNGLFASADIPPGGNVLVIQTPFVAALNTPSLEDTCSGCFGQRMDENHEVKACTGCGVVKYCDRTCQAKDWKFAHSKECSIFKKLKPSVLPLNVRAVLRMVLRCENQKYNPQELELLAGLRTHIPEIQERNQKQWERLLLSSKAIKIYAGVDMPESTIVEFLAKLDLNSFGLTGMLADCVGSYFHPFAALANHSCDHNAIVGFAGDVLYLKALRPIKKDEQIFVSYINTTEPYEFRQRVLSDQYYFDCRCSKCMKGTDTREDRFLTTPEDIEAVKLIDRQVHETLAPQDTLGNDAGAGKAASGMHTLRQTSIWPITRQPYVSLRSDLISNLLEIGRFKEAFVHSFVRYTRIDPIIYEEGHPLRQVHAWGLAKLAIYLCPDIVVKPDYSDIRKFGIDFSLIIWSILSDLVAKESQACTVPTLKRAVRASFMEVQGQYAAIGIDPRRMGTEIESEWEKVGKMVDECLKKQ